MRKFEQVFFAALFVITVPAVAVAGAGGHGKPQGHAEAHGVLAEPIFTKKALPENEIEIEAAFDNKDTENETELAIGVSKVFDERFQVGMEIPWVFRDPNSGSDVDGIGDVEFNLKYLVYRAPQDRFILALDAEIEAPTGDQDRETGEKGEWGLFTTAATAIPLGKGLPTLGVHFQGGYAQQIRTTAEQDEEAAELGVDSVVEKEVIYRLALNTILFDGRFSPTIEFLGKTVLDAIEADEEGEVFEIGAGFWWSPWAGTGSQLASLGIGIAGKGTVYAEKPKATGNYQAKLILKYEY